MLLQNNIAFITNSQLEIECKHITYLKDMKLILKKNTNFIYIDKMYHNIIENDNKRRLKILKKNNVSIEIIKLFASNSRRIRIV